MSPAAPLAHATAPSPADREAAARARIERQMARLERLADIGMEIAEAAGRRAAALAGGADADGADPGLSFSRAARAVRLTLMLQSRLAEALAALDRGEALARVSAAARRRNAIRRHIEDAAEAEGCDPDEVERLGSEAWERLIDDGDDAILDLPMDEAVARICRDLGLPPGLYAEDFADPPVVSPAEPEAEALRPPGRSARRSSDATPPPATGGESPPSGPARNAGTGAPGWGFPDPDGRSAPRDPARAPGP